MTLITIIRVFNSDSEPDKLQDKIYKEEKEEDITDTEIQDFYYKTPVSDKEMGRVRPGGLVQRCDKARE